jgi:hypothetical protein
MKNLFLIFVFFLASCTPTRSQQNTQIMDETQYAETATKQAFSIARTQEINIMATKQRGVFLTATAVTITPKPTKELITIAGTSTQKPTDYSLPPLTTALPDAPINMDSWFIGGSLHKSTVAEWRKATYANRLATSADFVAATQNIDYGNMEELLLMSIELESCISTATSGGNVENEQVSFIAAICIVGLFPSQ